MRAFMIDWSERLIAVFFVIAAIGVLIVGGIAIGSGIPGAFFQGLFVWVGGLIYLILIAGMMYVAFGIYRNTQETNRLLAELAKK